MKKGDAYLDGIKKPLKTVIFEYLMIICGSVIFAVALDVFLKHSHIVPGGFTGITTVLNYLFGLPIGATMLVLNIPLFIYSFKGIGKEFVFKTIISTVAMSAAIDLLAFLPSITDDRLLSSIYGGVLSGLGFSMIFWGGATSGGSDLLAKIITKYNKMSMGKMILIIDGIVITFSAIVYNDINSALYSIISLYISTHLIDVILTGFDFARATYIITSKPHEMSQMIMNELKRGVTLVKSTGMYTKNDRDMLLVVVKPKETPRLKEIIKAVDEDSFAIMTQATEVFGMGFKRYNG